MVDVRIPHASQGLVAVENKEVRAGDTRRGSSSYPATREFHRFLSELENTVNNLNSALETIQNDIAAIEARLTVAGI